jgi:WD40 repeat protein
MSRPGAPRKRDKYLDVLPFRRSRSKSPAQPVQPADNAPASGIDVPVEPATSPQLNQAATPKAILREDVLIRLDPEHQQVLRNHFMGSDQLDISASIQKAIDAAEEKKQLCTEKQWSMTIGGKKIVLRDKVNTVVDLISKFKDIGSIAVGADPVHAGLPWAGICLLLQVVVADKEQMDALVNGILVALSSQQTADLYLGCYNDQSAGPYAEDLRESLLRLYSTILAFLAEALRLLGASGRTRFCNALLSDEDLKKFPLNCRERLEDVGNAVRLCDRQLDKRTAELVADMRKNVADIAGQLEDLLAEAIRTRTKIDLAKLPVVTGAQHDSYSATNLSACLQGTRVDLLENINRWVDDHTSECLFWLQGIAGEGKSTVAKTVATNLQCNNKLGASFFFKSDDIDRADARRFFTTIAAQLAQRIDGMKAHIVEILDKQLTGYDKNIQSQFEDLIEIPLRKTSLQPSHSSFIIVVDALDECCETDIKHVIELLARCEVFGIRSLITSRPDAPVKKVFADLKRQQYRRVVLRDHTRDTIHHDIALFLECQFEQLRKGMTASQSDWPGRDVIQALTQRSVPLFIFATTVCAFIAKDDFFGLDEQLEAVLAETSEDRLSQTYLPVLKRLLKDRTPKQIPIIIEEFRNLVGPVVLSAEPLPVDLVINLHGLKNREQLRARLSRLHAVVHVGLDDNEEDQTIHPFHLSFRDFLVKPDEPHDFQIDERRVHASIANTCFSLMMEPGRLGQDICAVSKPGTRRRDVDTLLINDHIKPDLAYACRYWLYHQVRSGEVLDDSHQIYQFLTRHFLYWFEAMAWLGKAYEILPFLKQLKPFVDVRQVDARSPKMKHADTPQDTRAVKLRELVEDVQYFIRDFSYIADQTPLQLYASALTFTPKSSLVKSLFKDCMPKWIVLRPKVADDWEEESLVLEGHTGPVTAMTFSSSEENLATGKECLATCSQSDGTLRVWDCATGDCILKMPGQNNRKPFALSYSHDSQHLAAAFVPNRYDQGDSSISAIIYNVKTGKVIEDYGCIRAGVSGYDEIHLSLAFGPDSSSMLYIAIFCKGMLELWCTKPGSHTFEQAWSMRTPHKYFTISASTSLISCISIYDRSITSWRLDSGAYVSTHSIELGNSRSGSFYFHGFVDCRSRDLIHRVSSDFPEADGDVRFIRSNVQKLNTQTGHTTLVTCTEPDWSLQAICLSTGLIALTKRNTHVVHLLSLPQCSKTGKLTIHMSTPDSVNVAQYGEMILIAYEHRIELRDILGNVVFRGSEGSFRSSALWKTVCVSGDGSVVIAELQQGTHVWFVKSGTEVTLPDVGKWLCLPAVSNDSKLVAFCSEAAPDTRRDDLKDAGLQDTTNDRLLFWDLENSRQVKVIDRSYKRRKLWFDKAWILLSEDQKTLHTDQGDVNIEAGDWIPDSLHNRDKPERSISEDGSWLQIHGEDLLWLPESHRPQTYLFHTCFGKDTIAYDCNDGSVLTMKVIDPQKCSDSATS